MSGGKKKTIPPKTIPADMVKPDDSKNAELRKKFLNAKKVMLPEKTAEEKKALLKKQGPLTGYLKNYKVSFSKDLDKVWDQYDGDKNGYLDKVESEKFIEEVAGAIDQDRAYNYDKSKFKELFERFDDNKDWLLSKGEMAQFIKFAFRKSDATLAKDKAKGSKVNQKSLKEQVGVAYAKNFSKDLDELWTEVDNNNDGVLDKDECKVFLDIVKKNISQERAKNYDEARDFEKFFTLFDEDKNGYIAKIEMSVLLKKVFAKSPEEKALEKADKNKKNDTPIADSLGAWKDNLTGDIDAIYKEVSTDKKLLTKNQNIEFFDKVKMIVKPNLRFSKAEFDKK